MPRTKLTKKRNKRNKRKTIQKGGAAAAAGNLSKSGNKIREIDERSFDGKSELPLPIISQFSPEKQQSTTSN